MGAKCYRAMRRTEQRHSPRRIAKPPELSGLLPQLGPQVRDNINEGRRGQKGRICTRESNDVGKRVDFVHPVAAANMWRTKRPRTSSGLGIAAAQ